MEDYYKIIGTSREAVYDGILNKGERTDIEKDKFIKEKYNDTIKRLETKKSITTSPEIIKELDEQIQKCRFAYEQIKSPILRDIYNRRTDERKQQSDQLRLFRKETAYDILNTLKESMQLRSDEENDEILKQKRNQLLGRYSDMLANCENFSDRAKIELEMQKIIKSYEQIETAEKRNEYDEQLKREQEERDEKIRKLRIQNRYSHAFEYEPKLINSRENTNRELLENKMIIRREEALEEHSYSDKANRKLRIKQTATILFKDCYGLVHSDIKEYEIRRIIDGQEKMDIVYTDISIFNLSIDKKTGQPIEPKYYDCVINQLLSEDAIEGSRYNGGYIGLVEQGRIGNYYITLGEEKLNSKEKTNLTAVMMLKEKEQKIEEQGRDEYK